MRQSRNGPSGLAQSGEVSPKVQFFLNYLRDITECEYIKRKVGECSNGVRRTSLQHLVNDYLGIMEDNDDALVHRLSIQIRESEKVLAELRERNSLLEDQKDDLASQLLKQSDMFLEETQEYIDALDLHKRLKVRKIIKFIIFLITLSTIGWIIRH